MSKPQKSPRVTPFESSWSPHDALKMGPLPIKGVDPLFMETLGCNPAPIRDAGNSSLNAALSVCNARDLDAKSTNCVFID